MPSTAVFQTYKSLYNLDGHGHSEMDVGFYFDLAIRSLTTIHNMKEAGSWPNINYTKCSDYSGHVPVERDIDLATNFKVSKVP